MMNRKFKRKKFFGANHDFNFCKVLKSGQRKASQSTSDLNHNPTIVKNTIKRSVQKILLSIPDNNSTLKFTFDKDFT